MWANGVMCERKRPALLAEGSTPLSERRRDRTQQWQRGNTTLRFADAWGLTQLVNRPGAATGVQTEFQAPPATGPC